MKPRRLPPALFTLVIVAAVLLLELPAATVQGPPQRTTVYGGHEVVAGQVIVKFLGVPGRAEIARDTDADTDQEVGGIGARVIHSRSLDTGALIAALARRGDVEYVEPDYILYAASTSPNDPQFGQLWGLYNTGQVIQGGTGTPHADIGATLAWDITTGSRANVVTVIDTGIDYTHPDLAANVWSAPADFQVTIGGSRITCAIGTHGFNAITNTCDPLDDNNHGTHVFGTIGAVGNNGAGITGVNWTASVMGAKFLNSSGSGTTSNAINAIEFAVQARAALGPGANVRVLSNSWGGGGFSQALLDEINRANNAKMLFVAAAGNNGSNNDLVAFYPANYDAPNVVAVAATDNRDGLASFSNYGQTKVALGAPGVSILSTVRNSGYAYFSGTSMATPHVSGAAALLLSAPACSTLDTAGLKNTIVNTGEPISALSGKTSSGRRLNVFYAIAGCGAPPAPDFTLSVSPASLRVKRGSSGAYTITVTSVGSLSDVVGLSVTGVPANTTATISPTSVTPRPNEPAQATVTMRPASNQKVGTYTLTFKGTSGSLAHSQTVSFTVR